MTKRKFKNHYNQQDFKTDHERSIKPSMTIPDQSMSIKEMITRFTRGLPVYGTFVPEYDGGVDPLDGVDIRTLDLSEVHEIAQIVRERYNNAMDKFTKEQTKLQEEKRYQLRKKREEEEQKRLDPPKLEKEDKGGIQLS